MKILLVGAGGVGSVLIQLARQLTGLQVIATASRPETRDWCLALGAHAVIDFPFDAGSPCGALITGAFVVDPAAPLRDGCADALGPPGYTLDAELADLLFHDGAGKRGGATAWWPRLRARFLALPPPVRHALSRRAP